VAQVPEPVASVGALLQGRLAGVTVTEGSGNSGSGADIRLRGNVSATMSNTPLIYIDGVRAKSEPYPSSSAANQPDGSSGMADFGSPLSDINPEDIERVEIVKGPAATTLYGTEAAAGVIQIFTKRGSGTPQWTMELRRGLSYLRPFTVDEAPFGYIDPIKRNGDREQYSMSFGGGTPQGISYFASGSWERNEGPILFDYQKAFSVRGNVQFRPHEKWLLSINNDLSRSHANNVQQSSSGSGYLVSAWRGDLSTFGKGARNELVLRTLASQPNLIDVTRFINGMTLTFNPTTNFNHRLTVGFDFSQFESTRTVEFGYRNVLAEFRTFTDLGSINRVSSQNVLQSVDYVGSLALDITNDLRSTFSFGVQGVEDKLETLFASGNTFPGPGDYTISSTAQREGFQERLRSVTGGFFFQEMLGYRDRTFLTVGLRVDGSSAFGSGFGLQPYPKVSVSHVLSEESFWPESLGSMKLRAAYGWAGRAPGAFDAVKTWDPIGWGTTASAFQPGNLGNPELGPERTAEFELGFDASLFDDRFTADYTYYSRTTSDALFRVGRPVSLGDWLPQLENVGELKSWGHELSLKATVLARSTFRWELGTGITFQNTKVVSLGGAPAFIPGQRTDYTWIMEDQPVPVVRGDRIENYWEKADPIITKDVPLGPNSPPRIFTLSTSFMLPGGVALSGRAEYKGRYWMAHNVERLMLVRNIPMPHCYDAYRKVDPNWVVGAPGKESLTPIGKSEDLYAWERAKCFGLAETLNPTPIEYFELRDLTLSVPISSLVPALTRWANRTDLNVGWRNVWYWKNRELGFGHPEMTERRGSGADPYPLSTVIGHNLPPQSHVTISVRTVF
jgi:TonB-dependent SusC/RagA subfamily outer membrane receptor